MKRRGLATGGLAALACAGLALASEPSSQWHHWAYFRTLELEPREESRLVRATLPPEVYARAQNSLADLRLIDQNGQEVPYLLYARKGQKSRSWRPAQLTEIGFVPGQYTQAVVDTGGSLGVHNSVQIETEAGEFFAWVEVAASDDGKSWRILRERAPIYRFPEPNQATNQTLSYPETRSRYLRLHILEPSQRFALRAARVAQEVVEEAERERLPVHFQLAREARAQQSWWEADLGSTPAPASALRFHVPQPEFHRAVQVSRSEDGETWEPVGSSEVYRYRMASGDRVQEALHIEFPEASGRFWRIAILNRDDPPLAGLELELYGTPRHVVWPPHPGSVYRLLYGNSRAQPAQYGIARLVNAKDLEAALPARLGPEQVNPGYVDPRPWSERHPAVLWAALGLAVAVLAWLALQALRHPG